MATVKRKRSDGTWDKIGYTPISTPISLIGYIPPLPDPITPGDYPVVWNDKSTYGAANTSSLVETDCYVILPKAGTYRMVWGINCDYGTARARLYHGSTPLGTEQSVSQASKQVTEEVTATEDNYEVRIWLRSGSGSSYTWGTAGGLEARINWPGLEEILDGRS